MKNKLQVKAKVKKSSKDKWLQILHLLSEMTKEERERCLRATTDFFKGRAE